jgi:hypothetical protein
MDLKVNRGPGFRSGNGDTPHEDFFLDLKSLSKRCCMSVRSLRDHLKDHEHPLPSFRVGGKILVRWSDFTAWMELNFQVEHEDYERRISDAVNHLVGDA